MILWTCKNIIGLRNSKVYSNTIKFSVYCTTVVVSTERQAKSMVYLILLFHGKGLGKVRLSTYLHHCDSTISDCSPIHGTHQNAPSHKRGHLVNDSIDSVHHIHHWTWSREYLHINTACFRLVNTKKFL